MSHRMLDHMIQLSVLIFLLMVPMNALGDLSTQVGDGCDPAGPNGSEIRVMTLNANNNSNGWTERKQLVLDAVDTYQPDIIGLQESMMGNDTVILEHLGSGFDAVTHNGQPSLELPEPWIPTCPVGSGYLGCLAETSYSGNVTLTPDPARPESSGNWFYGERILYRTDRFSMAPGESGVHTILGSDNSTPLTCRLGSFGPAYTTITWARLVDRDTDLGTYVYNLHLCPPPGNGTTRKVQAERLAELIAARAHLNESVIVVGDLNEDLGGAGLQHLLRPETGLVDSFSALEAEEGVDLVTFNGYGGWHGGTRLDFVLSSGLEVCQAAIDRNTGFTEQGAILYPSDHWPVTTVLKQVWPDADGDGISDPLDNCTAFANPKQSDSDGDGLGNRCDADLNQNGLTNAQDMGPFVQTYGKSEGDQGYNASADFDENGHVDASDWLLFGDLYNSEPPLTCADSSIPCCMLAGSVGCGEDEGIVVTAFLPSFDYPLPDPSEEGQLFIPSGKEVQLEAQMAPDAGVGSQGPVNFTWSLGELEGSPAQTIVGSRANLSCSGSGGEEAELFVRATDGQRNGQESLPLRVVINDPPSVTMYADGIAVDMPWRVSTAQGGSLSLAAWANDEHGIGYPILQSSTVRSFRSKWNIGDAVDPSERTPERLLRSPSSVRLNFPLEGNEEERIFEVNVTSFDRLGSPSQSEMVVIASSDPLLDSDFDGIPDFRDNCQFESNASQVDSDQDGYGNRCDADLNQNGFVNVQDFMIFSRAYSSSLGSERYLAEADFNRDNFVNSADFTYYFMPQYQRGLPGPSVISCPDGSPISGAGRPDCPSDPDEAPAAGTLACVLQVP